MNREQVEQRMTALRQELEQASEELTKLRPRVQYLETIVQRLDGALTVLQGLLEDDTKQTVVALPPLSTDTVLAGV